VTLHLYTFGARESIAKEPWVASVPTILGRTEIQARTINIEEKRENALQFSRGQIKMRKTLLIVWELLLHRLLQK